MINKYKKELLIFISFFIVYFILGLIFTYYLEIYKYWDVMFDVDTPRVVGDLSSFTSYHYRASVHPLFIFIFQPIVLFLKLIFKDKAISILLLQSTLAASSSLIMYTILKKMGIKEKLSILLTILFGVSLPQTIYTSNIETYIYAQFFLMLLWMFVEYKIDKKLNYFDYIILILLGIGSISITLTNFIQYIFAIIFLICLNEKQNYRITTGILLIITSLVFTIFLAEIQNAIWPTAPNFFLKGLNDLASGTSEELSYIDTSIDVNKILNVINSNFSYSFNLSKYVITDNSIYLTFKQSIINDVISLILFFSFIISIIVFIIKSKFNIKKHKIFYAILCSYLFNFILHIFYGNKTAFLYICHYNFTIILIIAYILNYYKKNDIKNKYLFYTMLTIIVILSLNSMSSIYLKISPLYTPINSLSIIPIIIIILLSIIMIILIFKGIKRIIISLITIILILSIWLMLDRTNNYFISYNKHTEYNIII